MKCLTLAIFENCNWVYDHYQLESSSQKQRLHTGSLMWIAMGISHTKNYILRNQRQENTLEKKYLNNFKENVS